MTALLDRIVGVIAGFQSREAGLRQQLAEALSVNAADEAAIAAAQRDALTAMERAASAEALMVQLQASAKAADTQLQAIGAYIDQVRAGPHKSTPHHSLQALVEAFRRIEAGGVSPRFWKRLQSRSENVSVPGNHAAAAALLINRQVHSSPWVINAVAWTGACLGPHPPQPGHPAVRARQVGRGGGAYRCPYIKNDCSAVDSAFNILAPQLPVSALNDRCRQRTARRGGRQMAR